MISISSSWLSSKDVNDTGFSIPFKLSFKPVFFNKNNGAETRVKRSCSASLLSYVCVGLTPQLCQEAEQRRQGPAGC